MEVGKMIIIGGIAGALVKANAYSLEKNPFYTGFFRLSGNDVIGDDITT
jgi:predicted membrane protein